MAPAQSLPAIDEEPKPNHIIKSEAEEPKEKSCNEVCQNNDVMEVVDNGMNAGLDKEKEEEVEILECVDEGNGPVGNAEEDVDATECSSSFGNSFSGSDDGERIASTDLEVDSQFLEEHSAEQPSSNGYCRLYKKRKVSARWRRFISPLTWRCRWLELRMNELNSQASLYDKELARYRYEKQLQSKMIELDDSVSRLVPLMCHNKRKRAMKRRKRRRTEDTVDIASYMSSHNIFSYYENKRSEADGHSVDEDCSNHDEIMEGTDYHELSALGRISEDPLEQIFLSIESLHSRNQKLKSLIKKVICRISVDISSTPDNSFQGDPTAIYSQSHGCIPSTNGEPVPSYHVSEYELEDTIVAGSAVSSDGDTTDTDPDIIENTVGLLSATDGPLNQHNMVDSCIDIADGALINNQAADEVLQNFEVVNYRRDQPQELAEEGSESSSEDESTDPIVSEPETESDSADMPQPPVLKRCYTGKPRGRPKKRQRRGGSSAGWKRRRGLD